MTGRTRVSKNTVLINNWNTVRQNIPASGVDVLIDSATCIDSSPTYWRVPKLADLDNGGLLDIKSTKHTIDPLRLDEKWSNVSYAYSYKGALYPIGLSYRDPAATFASNDRSFAQLMLLGATAVSRTLPTNPSASLAQFLGEYRQDGLPSTFGIGTFDKSVIKQAVKEHRSAHGAGDAFLNYQFGWLPIVSDLKKFARAVKGSGKTIRQFHKDSDSKIRRRYSFPTVEETSHYYTGDSSPGSLRPGMSIPNVNALVPSLQPGSFSFMGLNETWFSGAFKYHIPLGNDLPSKMIRWEADANKLLGARLTPELVYELAPWSWAFDWFGNMGTVVHNISALGQDALVMQYGYIMNRFKTRCEYTMKVNMHIYGFSNGPRQGMSTPTNIVEYQHLQRWPATPYGFGFDMKSLSATQDAVLVALALSHGQR